MACTWAKLWWPVRVSFNCDWCSSKSLIELWLMKRWPKPYSFIHNFNNEWPKPFSFLHNSNNECQVFNEWSSSIQKWNFRIEIEKLDMDSTWSRLWFSVTVSLNFYSCSSDQNLIRSFQITIQGSNCFLNGLLPSRIEIFWTEVEVWYMACTWAQIWWPVTVSLNCYWCSKDQNLISFFIIQITSANTRVKYVIERP